MRHILFIGTAGAGAFLAGQPDLLFRDRRQRGQAGNLAGAGVGDVWEQIGHVEIVAESQHVINWIVTC